MATIFLLTLIFTFSALRPFGGLCCVLLISLGYPQYLFTDPSTESAPSFWDGPAVFTFAALSGTLLGILPKISLAELRYVSPLLLFVLVGVATAYMNEVETRFILMSALPYLGYVTIPAVLTTVTTPQRLRQLSFTLLIGFLLGSFGAVVEYYEGIGIAHRGYTQARSSVGQLAGLSGIFFVVASALWPQSSKCRLPGLPLQLSFATLYTGSALITMNRTAIASIALGVFLLFFFALRGYRSMRSLLSLITLGIALLVGVWQAGPIIESTLLGNLDLYYIEVDDARREEFELLTFDQSIAHSLIGAGIGSAWYSIALGREQFGCHNFFVQVFLQGGVLGVVLMLWFSITYLRFLFEARANRSDPAITVALLNWSAIMLAIFVLMGVSQNRFSTLHHTPEIGILLAMPLLLLRFRTPKPTRVRYE